MFKFMEQSETFMGTVTLILGLVMISVPVPALGPLCVSKVLEAVIVRSQPADAIRTPAKP